MTGVYKMKLHKVLAVAVSGIMLITVIGVSRAAAFTSPDTLVNVGSAASPFAQNKQNEPALAVDANHPNILAAGSNDEIDMEACNAGTDNTCPFTPGVGSSGIYFSFDNGTTWTQPTYTGWSARNCTGAVGDADAACAPGEGSIGTLPWYYENGLVSGGDPALAFGPKPDSNGHFDWANGSRLYYANLTSKFPGASPKETFKGFEAAAVSRTDDVAAAAANDKNAWLPPVIISQQSSTTFSDKEQIWADNASSSPYFGNVYACLVSFRSQEKGLVAPAPLMVATSTDGGDTWKTKQVTSASNTPFNPQQGFGRSGCTVRTDSKGVVYVFADQFAVGEPGHGSHVMIKSTNGGQSWMPPVNIGDATDTCFAVQFDGTGYRCVMDGIGGARDDLSSAPSVDIANGAPTGAGATDEILRSWVDGANGVNNENVYVSSSTDGGNTWSDPAAAQDSGDRGYYSAIAISPKGTDAYLVYNAFTTSFANDTSSARSLVGVVRHADIGAGGALGAWADLNRGASGDPRASAQNNLWLEFLGDYVYAVATDTYGAGVWNDMRNGVDCPAIDAWRAAAQDAITNGTTVPDKPAPQQDCPAGFGNSDIYGGSYADPTP
jgi:hypothetical protein